eukprot:scaffold912_cov422-Prasinococcus_capsulatus_cf.AAC.10
MLLSFQSLCARPRTGCTQSPRRRTVLSKEGSLSFKPPALPTNHVTKTTFPVATNGVTPVNTRRSWLSLGILSASVWTVARPAPSYASDDTASQEDIEMDEATKLELVGFTDPSYGFSLLRPRGWDTRPLSSGSTGANASTFGDCSVLLLCCFAMVRFLGSNEEAGCAGSVLLGRASLGVVVDPLKIPSLEKMGTADQKLKWCDTLLCALRGWSGIGQPHPLHGADHASGLHHQVSTLERQSVSGQRVYQYEYMLDTTKGKKRVQVAVGIAGNKLYVLNAQCKDKPENERLISVLREVSLTWALDHAVSRLAQASISTAQNRRRQRNGSASSRAAFPDC